ncbi:MAG: hypothetical protein K9K65_12455 [Desulfarculaceae bacterium]|nr:hypothetical protein [Desulfarculaceae bacterium]
MARVVNFPLARRLAQSRSWIWDNFWHQVWDRLPLKPSDDQRGRLELYMGACYDVLPRICSFVVPPPLWLPEVVKNKRSDRSPWPPQESEDWEIIIAAVKAAFVSLEKIAREGGKGTEFAPRKKATFKPPDALWAAIRPQVEPNLPTDRQARFISALIKEIGRLRRVMSYEPVEDTTAWVISMLRKLCAPVWPPTDRRVWGKLAGVLREHRDDLRAVHRQARRTQAQNKRIWALVAQNFGGDRGYLDEILRQNFPKAQRKGRDGRFAPSTKELSIKEASRLIDMLKHTRVGDRQLRLRG